MRHEIPYIFILISLQRVPIQCHTFYAGIFEKQGSLPRRLLEMADVQLGIAK